MSLFISDQRMPEISGVELLDEVRKRSPDLSTALLTGYPAPSLVERSHARGIPLILKKPWEDFHLRETILRILRECEMKGTTPVLARNEEARRMVLTLESGGPTFAGAIERLDENGNEDERFEPVNRSHIVVCVDDEAPVLAALRRTLRREPYAVLMTQDPQEALNLIQGGSVSLVITDQRMPSMAGTTLLDEARKCSPTTARFILTSYPGGKVISEGLNGATDWLISKPWKDADLKRLIRQTLRERELKEIAVARSENTQAHLRRPALALSDVREVVVRMDCAGRPCCDVLDWLAPKLRRAEATRTGLAFILDNLMMLEGEVVDFMRNLALRACAYGAQISMIDTSGGAAAALSAAESRVPFTLYSADPALRARGHFLVVEDDRMTADFLRTVVESLNCEGETAASPAEALERLKKEAFDGLILDLDLPHGGAFELAGKLLDLPRRPRVIPVGLRPGEWDGAGGARLGVQVRVKKPYRVHQIVEAIGECLR